MKEQPFDSAPPSEESYLIQLSAEDQARFVELLLNPPPLAPALERAREAHARLVTSLQ